MASPERKRSTRGKRGEDTAEPTAEELARFEEELARGVRSLVRRDPLFRPIAWKHGLPTFRPHGRHFATLAQSIVGQQISSRAADSILRKLREALGGTITPTALDAASDETLRSCGVSPQKLGYLRSLTEHVRDGHLHLAQLRELTDTEIITELTAVRGIGEWTAHMFLIFSLGRLDIFPPGDLAVRRGVQLLTGADKELTPREASRVAEERRWAPHRSIASWYLWAAFDPYANSW